MLPINTLNGVELGMEWGKEDHPRSNCFHSLLQQCFAGLEVFLHLKNLDQLVLLLSWIFNLIKKIYNTILPFTASSPYRSAMTVLNPFAIPFLSPSLL